ncbi:MAG: hypothetical protein VCD33_15720 [Alphaproteobacteria bacterium]
MTESYYSNAMVEIALALAMAFFSIMVLTMVSMGTGFQAAAPTTPIVFDAIAVAPATSPSSESLANDAVVIVHYQGRFYDAELVSIDPSQIADLGGRVVLAITPSLPMTEAIAARERIAATDVIVTTLSEDWLRTLEEMSP